jgi:hypothetical protein
MFFWTPQKPERNGRTKFTGSCGVALGSIIIVKLTYLAIPTMIYMIIMLSKLIPCMSNNSMAFLQSFDTNGLAQYVDEIVETYYGWDR